MLSCRGIVGLRTLRASWRRSCRDLQAVLARPRVARLSTSAAPVQTSAKVRVPDGVTVVNDRESAARALQVLQGLRKQFHACDTEVMDIDVKKVGPVGNGYVSCASIYCGPEVDFGNGPNLWIDNLDEAKGTLDYFKPYFESPHYYKVWHNYGFDRHVLANHDIHCRGFGADTMHMARLWNASLKFDGGYSLATLTDKVLKTGDGKTSMKDIFQRPKVKKDGTPGKQMHVPPIEDLQRLPDTRADFIKYSCLDAKATWDLRQVLEGRLRKMDWQGGKNMMDFYNLYWRPFGEMLTDMEKEGIYVDSTTYLPEIQRRAEKDRDAMEQQFRDWAVKFCPDAKFMNIGSAVQKQQFFFAPWKATKGPGLEAERVFQTENVDNYIEPGKTSANKYRPFVIKGLGMPPTVFTSKDMPAASNTAIVELCGKPRADPPKYGTAFDFFEKMGEDGREACLAIEALDRLSSINTMLNTFIIPLQEMADDNQRIHCSLNLNTETGRLSSRRPNLQNQPALEKDIYKIRQAFSCPPGRRLIVADYGQLELRLLAHMAQCKSMIDAFKAGGDFHSRTALGMYPHIQQAVKDGKCLLEWNDADGERPAPLIKDMFGSERRKAKTLNFSIAYGKTARGLSVDWGVSLKEAQETLEAWYSDRPEVRRWQQHTIKLAKETGATRTLMGRYRQLPDINSRDKSKVGHSERAAINTPIQGGAADVVMKAMLNLHADKRFRELGFKIVLQIHDEIIAEGPEEHAEEALQIVLRLMERPFPKPLLVDLLVDGGICDTWYEGK